jgi:hypothetical protein
MAAKSTRDHLSLKAADGALQPLEFTLINKVVRGAIDETDDTDQGIAGLTRM